MVHEELVQAIKDAEEGLFLLKRARLLHEYAGVDVPLASLKKYVPTIWKQSLVGSSIWAVPNANAGIWREAELESWDEVGVGQVVFLDDGSFVKVGLEALALSEYAE